MRSFIYKTNISCTGKRVREQRRGVPRWLCPAVSTHQVSDYPEYFDVGLLQEKPLGDEDTLRSLADQAKLCGRGGDQGFQPLSHRETDKQLDCASL